MHGRIATVVALALGALAVIAPISAALYLSHKQSMDEASGHALAMTSEALRRADAAGNQAIQAYRRLSKTPSSGPCTDARRTKVREITMDYSYLQAVGYVEGDRIVCSALGPGGDGAVMGPPSYISALGARVHTSVSMGAGKHFLVFERDGYAAAVYPEALLDIAAEKPELSLGIYGRVSQAVWTRRGAFDPRWLSRLGEAQQVVFFDGQHLVAIQASDRFDVAAYAAIPLSDLRSRLGEFIKILLPIGLALGAAMAGAILFLARQHNSLPSMLRTALRRKQFVLYYQPIVDLASGRMVGVEALLRWPANKDIGMRPALFIEAAEECGLIQRFTTYILLQVAGDAQRFIAQHPDCYISLNLSPTDLRSDDVVKSLERLVSAPGLAARNFVVEVTEHSFVDPVLANRTLAKVRALGIRVAIDDFGTGYSSLSHLTNLSADYLKVDKVFVDAIGTDSVTSEVVLHIIEMARTLGLTLISEGVETRVQGDFLQEHGVAYAQGWLFGKAQPLDELLQQRADPKY